jgi:hypothetical protein
MNPSLAVAPVAPQSSQSTAIISPFSGEAAFVAAQRIGKALCNSTLVPEMYRGEANMGNVLIAMELSGRLGASVLAVMQNMHNIHGRPSLGSPFLIATVNQSGKFSPLRFRFVGTVNADDWGCRAVAKDLGTGEELVGSLITIAMAKAEGWYTKTGSKWKTMPEQMLQYRAAAFWTRAYAPEVSLGMVTRDEAEDLPPEAVVVTTVTPTPSPEAEPQRRTRAKRETATVTEAPVEAVVVPVTETPAAETLVPTTEQAAPAEVAAPSTAQDWFNGWCETYRIPFGQFKERAVENEWPGFEILRDKDTCTPELQAFLQRSERAILRQFGKTLVQPAAPSAPAA